MKKESLLAAKFALIGASIFTIGATNPSKVAEAKNTFSKMSTNPTAAQFRNVVVGQEIVCGETNLPNRFGGFDGFQRFAFRDANHWALGRPRPSIDYELFWEGERLFTDPSTQKGMSTKALADAFSSATRALKLVTELRKACPIVPK